MPDSLAGVKSERLVDNGREEKQTDEARGRNLCEGRNRYPLFPLLNDSGEESNQKEDLIKWNCQSRDDDSGHQNRGNGHAIE